MHRRTGSNNVLVRQGNTLWWTCRAGGVHNTAKVFWRRRHRVNGVLLSEFPQILDAYDFQVAKVRLELLQVLLVDLLIRVVDDIFDGLDILQNVGKRADKGRVKEDSGTLGLNKRVLQSFFSQGIISGDNSNGL